MKNMKRTVGMIVAIVILGAGLKVFGLLGLGGVSWQEEVLLHDGGKIMVQRSQSRGGRHEIGQSPPVKEHNIVFTVPGSSKTIVWQDDYSNDIGHSNFDLLALHILNGTPYLVTSPFGCLAYNKWGRPNPPYVFFKYDGTAWQRISQSEYPEQFKEVNLVINTDGHEKELSRLGTASAEQVRKFNRSLPQPEYKSILREPLKPGSPGVSCPDYSSPRYMSPKAPHQISPKKVNNSTK